MLKEIGNSYLGKLYADFSENRIFHEYNNEKKEFSKEEIAWILAHPWSNNSSTYVYDGEFYCFCVDAYDSIWVELYADSIKSLINTIIWCMNNEGKLVND